MGVLFFINVESAARHNTEEERRNSCSLYPSIVFVCMLGCEVVCEPTNRKKSFVKRRRERKRTGVFLSFYFLLVLFLYSNHMMLDVDITQLRTQLAQCQQQLFANAQTFCSWRQRQENRKSTAFLSISMCPYESTHMRRIEKEWKINRGSNNSALSSRSNVLLSCSLYLNIWKTYKKKE